MPAPLRWRSASREVPGCQILWRRPADIRRTGSSEEGDGPEDEESGSGDVDELSPDDIAAEIEALRAELDSLSFRPEEPQDDE